MSTKISSIAYQKLYEVLYEQFVEKTWVNKEQQVPDSTSDKAWLEKNPVTGKFYFHELFRHTVDNPAHFVRKNNQIKIDKLPDVTVKEPLLFRVCEFIGFQLPGTIINSHPSMEQKAKILYQFFLEKHCPDHLEANRAELEVFNHKTGKLIKNSSEEKHDNETEAMTDSQLRTAIEEKAVRNLIGNFYESIAHARLEEAWDLLTLSLRKRVWQDDIEKFRIGYTNTVFIHHVHVFDFSHDPSGIKCKVYYEDDVLTYTSIELGNIGKIPISDFANLAERIKLLSERAASAGLEGFEKIELQKLFEPALSEYVWYRCGMNPEKIADFLPSQETLTIPRLYMISCIMTENEWLINAINPVKAHSIR